MLRSLFALTAVIIMFLLLCGCVKTAGVSDATAENPFPRDELSVDAQFYGVINVRTNGEKFDIYDYDTYLETIDNCIPHTRTRNTVGKAMIINAVPSGVDRFSPDFTGYSLYYYKDKLIHIADNTGWSRMSYDGSRIVYSKNADFSSRYDGDELIVSNDFSKSYADLYLWDGTKSEFIVNCQYRGGAEFSPDGKDLYYAVPEDDDEIGYYDWYFYNNGEPIFLFSDTLLLAVSNNSEYFYGYADGEYFVQKGIGGQRQFLALYDELETSDITYSADNSQVLFNTEDGFYISVNGGEAKRLSEPMNKLLLPELTNTPADFLGKFYLSNKNRIYKITEDSGELLVTESFYSAYMASDGETITGLMYSNTLYIATFNGNDMTVSTIFKLDDDSVGAFLVSYDGKTVFYANNLGELYVVKNGVKTLIEKNKAFINSYTTGVVYDNDKLFYAFGDSNKLMCYDGEKLFEVMKFRKDIGVSRQFGALKITFEKNSGAVFSYDGVNFLMIDDGIFI